jgi:hypothetical protein
LRSVKGTPLTNTEVDTNFSNLNTDKTELGGTYSAGTANGVLFLSSSKVLTTGSALTFDGTTLATTGALTVDGNTTLGNATTDTVTVNGYMGVGGALSAANGLRVGSSALTGTAQTGVNSALVGTSAATTSVRAFAANLETAAAAFTTSFTAGLLVNDVVKGAGSTITNQYGIQISDQTQGTNNYGISSLVSSGTNKWNIYASGTAQNYFAGNVGVGTATPTTKLEVSGSNNITFTVTASITGTTMDVTAVTSGTIAVGDLVSGNTVQPYTRVTAFGTGTGGVGSYTLSVSQTSTSNTMIGGATYGNTLLRITDTDTSVNFGQPIGGLQFFTNDASAPTAGVGAYVAAISESSTPDTALVFGTRDNAGGGVDANERMRIDSDGNVGIGTSSPSVRLQVSSATAAQIYATDTTSSNTAQMFASSAGAVFGSFTNAPVQFRTNNSERIRIASDGSVGIGTTSPTNLLSVAGNANVTGNTTLGDASTDTVTVNGYMGVGGAPATNVGFYVQNSALASVAQYGVYSGVVGTTAGTTALIAIQSQPATAASAYTVGDVMGFRAFNATKGAGSTITNQYGISISDQTQGTNNYGIASLVSSGTNKWNIYASGTADNYFAGNVGIGTSSPATRFELSGNNNGSTSDAPVATIRLSDTDTQTAADQPIGKIEFYGNDITVPSQNVMAYILSKAAGTSGGGDLRFGTCPNTAATERMRLDASGNLGIGTSSPEAKLQVAGGANPYLVQNSGRAVYGIDIQATAGASGAFGGALSFGAGSVGRAAIAAVQGTTDADAVGITFFTHNSGTGAADAVEAMRIASAGNVGIGNTSPFASYLDVGDAASTSTMDANGSGQFRIRGGTQALAFAIESVNLATIYTNSNSGALAFGTNETERLRITVAGNLLVGTTSARTAGGITPALQVESTTVNGGSQYLTVNNATAANSPILQLNRSRGTAVGDVTAVASGDTLGRVFFAGADGTGLISAASISAAVDGTPGTNDMPGRLVFSTTADGASSPTERMRIDSAGNLVLGQTSSALQSAGTGITVYGTTSSEIKFLNSTSGQLTTDGTALVLTGSDFTINNRESGYIRLSTNNAEAMRITSAGNVGIGTASPSVVADRRTLHVVGGSAGSIFDMGGSTTATIGRLLATESDKSFNMRAADASGFLTFQTGGANERMRIDSAGNVGIGTSSPLALFHVQTAEDAAVPILGFFKNNATAGTSSGAIIRLSGVSTANRGADIIAANDAAAGSTAHYLAFATSAPAAAPTERMRIDSAGNLLVGLTSATGVAKLQVSGPIQTTGYTVATLPAGTVGMRTYVTDALAPSFGVTVAGSGAVTIPVFYNGTNWIVA